MDCSISVLCAGGLAVALDDKQILREVDFSVERGTWVGLLGPNGSGKTTLLRTISGVLPYRGSLTLFGRPVSDWKPRELARRLGFVRQSPALAFDFCVEDLVLLGRAPHRGWFSSYTATDRARVRDALACVDLAGFEHRSVLSLSGGELQRVFLAQALVQETDLLLLDEPTAHLDVHYQYALLDQIRDLVRAGRTAIAVFHDLEQAARYADALLVLRQGRLVASGAPRDVLTPSLIADVFHMHAHVGATPGDALRISYIRPLRPSSPRNVEG